MIDEDIDSFILAELKFGINSQYFAIKSHNSAAKLLVPPQSRLSGFAVDWVSAAGDRTSNAPGSSCTLWTSEKPHRH